MLITKFYTKIYQNCDNIQLLQQKRNEETKIILLELLRDFVIVGCCIFLWHKGVPYAIQILLFGIGVFVAGIISFVFSNIMNFYSYKKILKEIKFNHQSE